jgi:hypothetical protein
MRERTKKTPVVIAGFAGCKDLRWRGKQMGFEIELANSQV